MMDISFAFRFLQKTAIGLFTNYLGFTTLSYKAELVRTLVHYAFMISSSFFFMKRLLKLSIRKNYYLILAIIQVMSSARLIYFVNFIVRIFNIKVVLTPFNIFGCI